MTSGTDGKAATLKGVLKLKAVVMRDHLVEAASYGDNPNDITVKASETAETEGCTPTLFHDDLKATVG